jgi:phosphate transport system permease protein
MTSSPNQQAWGRVRGGEPVVLGVITAVAALSAVVYGGMLVYLILRGLSKIVTFTTYPTPLTGIDGETGMRVAVAAGVGAAIGWAITFVLHEILARVAPRTDYRVSPATPFVIIVVAALMVLVARDHLPRFLISMPSETTRGGGVGPEIFNTIYFAVLSTLVTVPIGVGAAVYLARFAGSKPFRNAIRIALDTLASLPSIIYGLFGFLVFVVQMHAGYSLLAGAFVLALLNLPLVVGITEEAIQAVPRELEDASIALAATRAQTVWRVTLPYAWPGILSAAMLSIGRVFAESAPLIMTAGTTVSRVDAYSLSPMRGGETLAVHLWYVNSSGLSPDRVEVSAGTAAILVVLVGLTNLLVSRLSRYGGATGTRSRKIIRRLA